MVRIQREGSIVVDDGAGVIVQETLGCATAVVDIRIIRVQCDGTVIVGDGAGVIAMVRLGNAPGIVDSHRFSIAIGAVDCATLPVLSKRGYQASVE